MMNARERILEAALGVFAELGSRGATTRRIADAAGVNEVTLFRQFGSKDVLLREALEWASHQVRVSGLPADPRDAQGELTEWSRENLRALYQTRALLRTSMGEFESNPEISTPGYEMPIHVARELERYLHSLQNKGMADARLDARGAAAMLMGALFSDAVSRDIMPGRYPYSLDESAGMYVRLFLRAIGSRPPAADEVGE